MDSYPRSDQDSGYGSLKSQEEDEPTSRSPRDFSQDQLIPPPNPPFTSMIDQDETMNAEDIYQAQYVQCQSVLTRAIARTVDLFCKLRIQNAQWPTYYPTDHPPESDLQHSNCTRIPHPRPSPRGLSKDAGEMASDHRLSESNHGFSVLRLDLKIASTQGTNVFKSLGKETIALLLDAKIGQTVEHLFALRNRMQDKSSKILVTGDLNAGKSTFCNALLRRKVLPEDQQPCTNVFCEILHAQENSSVEELHAVHQGVMYDRDNKSTYDSYSMQDLDRVVTGYGRYWQCKVYINKLQGNDDDTLLNNGFVDITLIDAPGLNSDLVTTTAVFARQEEIDVVVFVVSAANHFTQSATDFIRQAAYEKAHMFIVVNGLDYIRDKKRCQSTILEQLALLCPQTFKEASELVHFVSSNTIPTLSFDEPRNWQHHTTSGLDQKEGEEKVKTSDFEVLEAALRRFVLDKRARTKLAPARTFLLNCLKDLHTLAAANYGRAISERDRMSKEIACLEIESLTKSDTAADIGRQAEVEIAKTTADVYQYVQSTLSNEIKMSLETDHQIEYPGLLYVFQYASSLKGCILGHVSTAVQRCEQYGRMKTDTSVNMLKSLGVLHVSGDYKASDLRADMMFRRRKDAVARNLEVNISILDFFDLSDLWTYPEKLACSSVVLTTAVGTLGSKVIGQPGWISYAFSASSVLGRQRLRWVILPGIMTTAALLFTLAISRLPQALPRRLANKIHSALDSANYIQSNAHRISSEVHRVLRFPAQQLAMSLQKDIGERKQKMAEMEDTRSGTEMAIKYFGNLVREASEEETCVKTLELD